MRKPPLRPSRDRPDPEVPNDMAIGAAHGAVAAQLAEAQAPAAAMAADGQPRETTTPEQRHEQRMAWFYSEAARQSSNRALRARCEAFYDSEQWEHSDAEVLRERGQNPIVYNEIKPTIDYLIGTERRSRTDFYVVAEDDDPGADDDAITKTKLLKYLEDVNKAPFERSDAADDQFKGGLGIVECGVRNDKTEAPVFLGHVPWREYLHDSRAKKDQSDARFNFRIKLVDLDVAMALLPGKDAALRAAVISGDSVASLKGGLGIGSLIGGLDAFDSRVDTSDNSLGNTITPIDLYNTRERVLLIECWSREPQRAPLDQLELGDPISFKIRVAIMTENETLLEGWSPFKHDRFPFVLYWAYRNKRTGMPYSPIFSLLGPQGAMNHRMSRALFEASFNQFELEASAIDKSVMDIDELRDEYNDPNGMAVVAAGALAGGKIRKVERTGEMAAHLQLAAFDQNSIRAQLVNEENRGLSSQATSRVAMDAKAERGSVGTAELFDNILFARQQEGEILLSLCEQYMKAPMTIRVAGEQGAGKFERTRINQWNPETGQVENDISARRAHFVVGEQAWKQSYAEAAFQSLVQVLTQLASSTPQIVVSLLDVVFDMFPNLPRKKVVLQRIRAVNGQADPDGKTSPEQQQAQAQKAQVAQAQFQAEMAKTQAEIKKAQAQGQKLEADAMLVHVTALYEAAQAAQVLGQAPALTPIADQILESAGYVDQSGTPNTLGPGAAPMQAPNGLMPPQIGGPLPHVVPPLMQTDGAQRGIETMRPDGAQLPAEPPAPGPEGAQ